MITRQSISMIKKTLTKTKNIIKVNYHLLQTNSEWIALMEAIFSEDRVTRALSRFCLDFINLQQGPSQFSGS